MYYAETMSWCNYGVLGPQWSWMRFLPLWLGSILLPHSYSVKVSTLITYEKTGVRIDSTERRQFSPGTSLVYFWNLDKSLFVVSLWSLRFPLMYHGSQNHLATHSWCKLVNVPGLIYIIPGTLTSRLAAQKLSNKQNVKVKFIFKSPNQIILLNYNILYKASVIMN